MDILKHLVRMAGIIFASAAGLLAQTSTERVAADPKSQYYLVKNIMRDVYQARKDEEYADAQPDEKKANELDLVQCESLAVDQDIRDPVLMRFAVLAGTILTWRNELSLAGYPQIVWRPPLIEFENQSIQHIVAGLGTSQGQETFQHSLRTVLNQYRQQNNPGLPNVIEDGGCGGGPEQEPVLVKTSPPGARIALLSKFNERVCNSQKVDPTDTHKCDRWIDLASNTRFNGVGKYVYCLQWKDERRSCGQVDFDKIHYDYDGKPTEPMILVKPL